MATYYTCSECGEPVTRRAPTISFPYEALGVERPRWSHVEGEPLCPVMGTDGYEPSEPVSRLGPDLDDTTGCPIRDTCEACGTTGDLVIATADTRVGVYCATLCGSCVDAGRFGQVGWSTATERALDHCGHLGITANDMAAQRAMEQGQ